MDAHLVISGIVQGVGFRQFVRQQAQQHGVTGWVRNTPAGSVEALLQGEKESVEEVIDACYKGPFLAEVRDIAVSWQKSGKQYNDFSIRH